MWLSFGPVCATYSAHSGAARQHNTISTNTAPHANASLLRRSRSQPRYHGLRPAICAAGTPACRGGSPGTSSSPTGATILLQRQGRPVLVEQGGDGRPCRNPCARRRRSRTVRCRKEPEHRLLHVRPVHVGVLLFDAAIAEQLRQQLVLLDVQLTWMLTRDRLFPLVGRMLSPCNSGRKKSSGWGKSWYQLANPVSRSGVDWVTDGGVVDVACDHLEGGVEPELPKAGRGSTRRCAPANGFVVGPHGDVLLGRIGFGDKLFRPIEVRTRIQLETPRNPAYPAAGSAESGAGGRRRSG